MKSFKYKCNEPRYLYTLIILDKRPTAGERTDRMDGCRQHGGVNFRGHGTGCRRSQDRPGLLFRKIQR